MRNEFFGDVADYSKYGVLREIGRAKLKLAVAWMLTPDRGTPGRHIGYLRRPQDWRKHDPELFDWLSDMVGVKNRREVSALEKAELIPDARFIRGRLAGDRTARSRYFEAAASEAAGVDVLFLDPDTGIAREDGRMRATAADGYIFWNEIDQLFQVGCSLLIYQHYPRGGARRIDGCSKMQSHVAAAFRQVGAPYVATIRLSATALLLLGQAHHATALDQVLERIEWQWRDRMAICKHRSVDLAGHQRWAANATLGPAAKPTQR